MKLPKPEAANPALLEKSLMLIKPHAQLAIQMKLYAMVIVKPALMEKFLMPTKRFA